MDAALEEKFQEIIQQGEKLLPEGGMEASGYNAKMQGQYLLWRKSCLEVIQKIGDSGTELRAKIINDEKGTYFYQSSAQFILDIVKQALVLGNGKVSSTPTEIPTEKPIEKQETSPPVEKPKETIVEKPIEKPKPVTESPKIVIKIPKPQETPKVQLRQETIKTEIPKEQPKQEPVKQEIPKPQIKQELTSQPKNISKQESTMNAQRVLVVTPANHQIQGQLASFLKEIGIEIVIYQRTENVSEELITFVESHTDVKFAFYLFTAAELNTMFELGYLVGKYGAGKVCCIYTKNAQLPKSMPGVSKKEITLKLEEVSLSLIKELKAAGYAVAI